VGGNPDPDVKGTYTFFDVIYGCSRYYRAASDTYIESGGDGYWYIDTLDASWRKTGNVCSDVYGTYNPVGGSASGNPTVSENV